MPWPSSEPAVALENVPVGISSKALIKPALLPLTLSANVISTYLSLLPWFGLGSSFVQLANRAAVVKSAAAARKSCFFILLSFICYVVINFYVETAAGSLYFIVIV